MAEPARKPAPPSPSEPTPAPRLRPRAVRAAAESDASRPSEARRLQDRVAAAFTTPGGGKLEPLLMKLIIVAATCLVLRTAIIDGAGALGLLR